MRPCQLETLDEGGIRTQSSGDIELQGEFLIIKIHPVVLYLPVTVIE
jgi:hypothetical protein